ncbi:MAG TPA: DUF4097 family beta strand repeat-containing protein [Steroidobacter sp.]
MKHVFCVAVMFLCAGAALAETVERRSPADPNGEVEIGNVAGRVEVVGWNRAEVELQADIPGGADELRFERRGSRTVIQIRTNRHHGGAADLTVRVPQGSSLMINTVSGEQQVEGVRGRQRLQSVSGSIDTEVFDEFEIETASGEISVQGHGGQALARVTTVSGDVRLEDIGSELELNTVSGDMNVRARSIQRARINTTNGDLDFTAALAPDARIDAEAINGDLRFEFLGAVNAEFAIETFNGDIDNCFGPKARRSRDFGPGNELRFKEGKGGATVRVKTLNGGVELCKR